MPSPTSASSGKVSSTASWCCLLDWRPPRWLTAVMGHTVRFLRYLGIRILPYLDDLIFAAVRPVTAREALTAGQMLLRILPRFGWLIHPTKCVGCAEPTVLFVALETLVDLAAQQFRVPADKLEYLLGLARDVAGGPDRVPAQVVARLKGLITSSWVAVGNATRVRTWEMDCVSESRPRSFSLGVPPGPTRVMERAGRALFGLPDGDRMVAAKPVPHQRPGDTAPPVPARLDNSLFADASDTGAGAVLSVDWPGRAGGGILVGHSGSAPSGPRGNVPE